MRASGRESGRAKHHPLTTSRSHGFYLRHSSPDSRVPDQLPPLHGLGPDVVAELLGCPARGLERLGGESFPDVGPGEHFRDLAVQHAAGNTSLITSSLHHWASSPHPWSVTPARRAASRRAFAGSNVRRQVFPRPESLHGFGRSRARTHAGASFEFPAHPGSPLTKSTESRFLCDCSAAHGGPQ